MNSSDIVSIVVALISALVTIITVLVTNRSTQEKMLNELRTQNEVQNTKIEHLTEEVRTHNNFARRMPVVEEQVRTIFKQLDKISADSKN